MENLRGSEIFNQQYSTKENMSYSLTSINQILNSCQNTLNTKAEKNVKLAKTIRNVIEHLSLKPTIRIEERHDGLMENAVWLRYESNNGKYVLDIEFKGNMIRTFIYSKDDHSRNNIIQRKFNAHEYLLLNSYVVSFKTGKQKLA